MLVLTVFSNNGHNIRLQNKSNSIPFNPSIILALVQYTMIGLSDLQFVPKVRLVF